ncbi:MAG: hypothetical protein ABEJ07_04065 [Candidatus Nanohaloarchaea archaeon]
MRDITRYEDHMEYLPKKEREALREISIEEEEVESAAEAIIEGINLSRGNGIKALGGER